MDARRRKPPPADSLAWSSEPRAAAPAPAPAGAGSLTGTGSSKGPGSSEVSGPGKAPAPARRGPTVRVRLERQGRGGKVVTVVDGLPGHPDAIEDVARRLKAACGAGGTTRGRFVKVQGDHRERVAALLRSLGMDAKRAGG